MHQFLRLKPKQFFLQLTQSTRVIQDESEPSKKSDEVRHLKNDVPEIIVSYHVSIFHLEKGNLFLIKYVTLIKILAKEGTLINVFSLLT